MSSAMKDARWKLASTVLAKAGLEYGDIGYGHFQALLDACQTVLVHTSMGKIQDLADEWNRGA